MSSAVQMSLTMAWSPMLDGNYQEDGAPSTGMQNDAMSPMR